MILAAARTPEGYDVQPLDASGRPLAAPRTLTVDRLLRMARHPDYASALWVMDRVRYPAIELRLAGLSLPRAHDLWLTRRILRNSPLVQPSDYTRALRSQSEPPLAADPEDRPWLTEEQASQETLFEGFGGPSGRRFPGLPHALARGHNRPVAQTLAEVVAEFQEQTAAVAASSDPRRLGLLVRAESAGGLVAADLEVDGLPWDRAEHERLLTERLGPRTPEGVRPRELERRAQEIEGLLGVGKVNPDSPADVLRALKRAGFQVSSTRKWELRPLQENPAVAAILQYKKLSRLATTNGWHWLDTWVHGGRLRSEYVPGGVPSGRWVSLGGGLMQLPRELRATVRAEPGRKLVVADVSQLEPRVLAAMSRDTALAEAARGHDLYQAIADDAFEGRRDHAKIAVLGAMYGATTGEAGAYVPVLTRAYPRAVALVEEAARRGEQGLAVQSFLGRGTPVDGLSDREAESLDPLPRERQDASAARAYGRFARNFAVQSSAAEWALCWLGTLRTRLRQEFPGTAELVYFLHDEVILHADDDVVPRALALVQEAADQATRTLFGEIPVDFPLTAAAVQVYAETKE